MQIQRDATFVKKEECYPIVVKDWGKVFPQEKGEKLLNFLHKLDKLVFNSNLSEEQVIDALKKLKNEPLMQKGSCKAGKEKGTALDVLFVIKSTYGKCYYYRKKLNQIIKKVEFMFDEKGLELVEAGIKLMFKEHSQIEWLWEFSRIEVISSLLLKAGFEIAESTRILCNAKDMKTICNESSELSSQASNVLSNNIFNEPKVEMPESPRVVIKPTDFDVLEDIVKLIFKSNLPRKEIVAEIKKLSEEHVLLQKKICMIGQEKGSVADLLFLLNYASSHSITRVQFLEQAYMHLGEKKIYYVNEKKQRTFDYCTKVFNSFVQNFRTILDYLEEAGIEVNKSTQNLVKELDNIEYYECA